MKSILSLILPANRGAKISRRYLKGGRKAIGFEDQQLITVNASGIETGIQSITSDDLGTHTGAGPHTISKRVSVISGAASAVTVNLPQVSGELREVILINQNSGQQLNVSAPGALIAGATVVYASGVSASGSAQFLSNGSSWYRVV
jgi:hypothetical protein